MQFERSALVIVDVQNDFVSGSMAIPGSEAIIDPINRIAPLFPTVVAALDWHPRDHISFASNHPGLKAGDFIPRPWGQQKLYPDHCVQGTPGAEPDPRLKLDTAALLLRKGYQRDLDSFSAFHWNDGTTCTGLAGYLRDRGIEKVWVCGLARLGCVLQSALGAAREGFETHFIDDASMGTAGRDEAECLAMLHDAGVKIVTTQNLG